MSRWAELSGKDVVLRLDFMDEAIKATIILEEDGVLVIKSPGIRKALTAAARTVAVVAIENFYYIPVSRVQFVMVRPEQPPETQAP